MYIHICMYVYVLFSNKLCLYNLIHLYLLLLNKLLSQNFMILTLLNYYVSASEHDFVSERSRSNYGPEVHIDKVHSINGHKSQFSRASIF